MTENKKSVRRVDVRRCGEPQSQRWRQGVSILGRNFWPFSYHKFRFSSVWNKWSHKHRTQRILLLPTWLWRYWHCAEWEINEVFPIKPRNMDTSLASIKAWPCTKVRLYVWCPGAGAELNIYGEPSAQYPGCCCVGWSLEERRDAHCITPTPRGNSDIMGDLVFVIFHISRDSCPNGCRVIVTLYCNNAASHWFLFVMMSSLQLTMHPCQVSPWPKHQSDYAPVSPPTLHQSHRIFSMSYVCGQV